MRIAVTGHMDLAPDSVPSIQDAIACQLERYDDGSLTGISCIARGADSIFAETVLAHGGALEVVLPSSNYREAKVKPDHAAQFDELVRRAVNVRVMPFDTADRAAYEAANEALLTGCDVLFAVWDGQSTNKGGTGTTVEYAESLGVSVRIIWPVGAARGSDIRRQSPGE